MEKSPNNKDSLDFNEDELLNMVDEQNSEMNNDRKSGRKRISEEKINSRNELPETSKVKKTSTKTDIKEELNKQDQKKKKKKKEKENNEGNENELEINKKVVRNKGRNKNQETKENNNDNNDIILDERKSIIKLTDKATKKKSDKSISFEDNEIILDKKDKKEKKNAPKSETPEETSKPKKEKKETSVKRIAMEEEEGDRKTILEYMISQNRPYSAINIFDNLHKKIKKPQVIKILDDLANENKLLRKEYNQKIYLASQSFFPAIDENETKTLDQTIELKKKEQDEKQQILKKLQNEYRTITSKLTDDELKKKIKEKIQYLEETQCKLKKYQCGEYNRVPDEEVKLKEKNYENVKNNYKKVRKICIDIVDGFCEAMEMKRSEVMV